MVSVPRLIESCAVMVNEGALRFTELPTRYQWVQRDDIVKASEVT